MLGIGKELPQVLELLLHEKSGDGGLQQMRDRFGGCVRAVCRTERVVDVEVAQRRECFGELGLVLLFAGPEPRVLDEGNAAASEATRGCYGARRIRNEFDRGAEQLLEIGNDLLQRVLRIGAALWATEMRKQHDARAFIAQILDRRQRGTE